MDMMIVQVISSFDNQTMSETIDLIFQNEFPYFRFTFLSGQFFIGSNTFRGEMKTGVQNFTLFQSQRERKI